ncbi:MAG: shikimate kinase, partial [Pseudomonadota bacterium]
IMEAMNHWLAEIGRRVRSLRAQRGVSRKHLSNHSEISERYLAQVESGQANLSFAMLYKISRALDVNLLDLIDLDRHGPEDAELHALINRMEDEQKHKLLAHVQTIVGTARRETAERYALLGMRGAGKSTIGHGAAKQLGLPFIRISDRIVELAGMSLAEIMDLGGQNAYRRWEAAALNDIVDNASRCIIETGGSLVAEAPTYNLLRERCTLVWIQAQPEQHMNRVMQQGDMRPFDRHQQSLDDLKLMLQERETFYSQADFQIDTSTITADSAIEKLCAIVQTQAA